MRLLSDDREPAVTYEKAVWWLLSFSHATVDFVKSSDNIDAMPIEAVIVADIYWTTKKDLRKKLKKCLAEIDPSPRSYGRGFR